MKNNKKYLRWIMIGILLVNVDFLLKHYTDTNMIWIDVLKGIGVGVMVTSSYLMSKHRKICTKG